MKNGKLVATLGAVALVAAVGLGSTLAYLTAGTDTVTNTFTMGNVSFAELGNGLTESEVARNDDGVYADIDGKGIWSKTSQDYDKLYPGETVYKDPTVTMSDKSEDAWLFAKVAYDKNLYTITYNTDEWAPYDTTQDGYDIYYKTETIAAEDSSTIFTAVKVNDGVEEDATLTQIDISAAAVQAVGVNTTDDAFDAIEGYLVPED